MSVARQSDSPASIDIDDPEGVPEDIRDVLCKESIDEIVKEQEKQERNTIFLSRSNSCDTTSHCSDDEDWAATVPEDIREVFSSAAEKAEASLLSKQQQQQPASEQPTLHTSSEHSRSSTTNSVKQRTKRFLYQPSQDSAIVQYGKHKKQQQKKLKKNKNKVSSELSDCKQTKLQETESNCLTVATKVVDDDLASLGAPELEKADPLFPFSNTNVCCQPRLPKILQHKYAKYCIFLTIIVILVAAAVVAWSRYMECPECRFESFREDLEQVFGPDLLKEPSSGLALEWMRQQSQLSVQRFVVAAIYFSTSASYEWNYCAPARENDGDHCHASILGIRVRRGKRWLSEHRHECTWMGIKCNRKKEIIEVDLSTFLTR